MSGRPVKMSVSAGVSASFNFNYQWASTVQDQFST